MKEYNVHLCTKPGFGFRRNLLNDCPCSQKIAEDLIKEAMEEDPALTEDQFEVEIVEPVDIEIEVIRTVKVRICQ